MMLGIASKRRSMTFPAAEPLVPGALDLAHPARTDERADLVDAEFVACFEHSGSRSPSLIDHPKIAAQVSISATERSRRPWNSGTPAIHCPCWSSQRPSRLDRLT